MTIQRDRYGYGLTVSGDNPVYVRSVREGGAAHRAGININDQIIKVKAKSTLTFDGLAMLLFFSGERNTCDTLYTCRCGEIDQM